MTKRAMLCGLAVLALAGCRQQDAVPAQQEEPGRAAETIGFPDEVEARQADAPSLDAPPMLEDVMEHDPRYLAGISYPQEARQYPGLAIELDRYAAAARAELDEALVYLGEGRPSAPYELFLEFSMLAQTPRVVAVQAEGSLYTGGAHGNPLVARFVWLPEHDRLLEAKDLIPDEAGWRAVSSSVRGQLHEALSQRVEGEELEPAEREQNVRSAGRMIDDGTTPEAGNFAHFEPLAGSDGRIHALRFVFPPYQVAPYSEGTRSADVPASVLLPHVAPAYRALFAGG